jgi:hypothetical protein
MKRFLTMTVVGPVRMWHVYIVVAAFYVLAGAFGAGYFVAGNIRRPHTPTPPALSATQDQKPEAIRAIAPSLALEAPISPPVAAAPARPQAQETITIQEFLALKPREPVLVRGQMLLAQADVGFVGQGSTMDSFIFRDDADAQPIHQFEQLRNTRLGRRLYYLLGNGAVRTMTLKMDCVHVGGIVDIVNEN